MNAENAFDKIRYLFRRKTLNKLGIEGTQLNIVEVIYEKLIVTFFKIRNEKMVPTLTTPIQYSNGSSTQSH